MVYLHNEVLYSCESNSQIQATSWVNYTKKNQTTCHRKKIYSVSPLIKSLKDVKLDNMLLRLKQVKLACQMLHAFELWCWRRLLRVP